MGRGTRIDRVFYELGAEVDDFQKGMANAEKSAMRFSTFVMKHPYAAIGALTAAMAAVAVQATRMAAAMETNMRRAAASMPALRDRLTEITKQVTDLSKETPRTALELSQAFAEIAKSTKDPDEAMKRLRASTLAADASGADLATTYGGLDAVLDAFNLSGHESEVVLAKVAAAARATNTELPELLEVLTKNGAELHRMGFGLDEAALRMGALLDAGVPAKSIMAQFKAVTKEVTGQTLDAAKALRELHGAAAFSREGTENLSKILKNQLSAQLLELGTKILPVVNAELKGMLGLIALFDGTIANIKTDAVVNAIEMMARSFDKLSPESKARDLKRLKDSLAELQKLTGFQAGRGSTEAKNLTDAQLRAYLAGVQTLLRAEGPNAGRGQLEAALRAEFERRGLGNRAETQSLGAPRRTLQPIDPDLENKRKQMIREAQDALVQMAGSARAALDLELTRIAERAREVFGTKIPAEVQQWMDGLREQFAATDAFDAFTKQFDVLKEKSAEGAEALRGGYAGAIAEATEGLRGLETVVRAELATSKLTVEQRERSTKLLKEIETQLHENAAAAGKSVQAAKDENAERDKGIAKAKDLGREIASVARGALQLAEAFGLADERSTRLLNNAIQLGENLPAALRGDPTAIFGALSGGIALIKNLFGGGGGGGVDPSVIAEQERRAKDAIEDQKRMHEERLRAEELTRIAIQELAMNVGDLGGLNLTGRQVAGTKGAIENLLANGRFDATMNPTGALVTGAQLAEMARIAAQLGLELDPLNPSLQQFRDLLEALNAIEIQQFAQTFMGQLEALRAEFELFDLTDPIDQLKRMVELFSNPNFGAPALRDALAGLDLSSPEGRAQAKAAIQALFEQLQAGTLDPAALGGLTGQQLLEMLLQLNGLLASANDAGLTPTGETRQFTVERRITEVQADRLIAIETTMLAIETEHLTVAKQMRDYLASLVMQPIALQAPPLSALSGFGAGGVTVSLAPGSVVIHVGPGADAKAVQDAVGQGVASAIAQQLEHLTRGRTQSGGTASLMS